jgi:hypothetical protein
LLTACKQDQDGTAVCAGGEKYVHSFDGKSEGERLPGRSRIMLDNNIEVDLIKEDGRD